MREFDNPRKGDLTMEGAIDEVKDIPHYLTLVLSRAIGIDHLILSCLRPSFGSLGRIRATKSYHVSIFLTTPTR